MFSTAVIDFLGRRHAVDDDADRRGAGLCCFPACSTIAFDTSATGCRDARLAALSLLSSDLFLRSSSSSRITFLASTSSGGVAVIGTTIIGRVPIDSSAQVSGSR